MQTFGIILRHGLAVIEAVWLGGAMMQLAAWLMSWMSQGGYPNLTPLEAVQWLAVSVLLGVAIAWILSKLDVVRIVLFTAFGLGNRFWLEGLIHRYDAMVSAHNWAIIICLGVSLVVVCLKCIVDDWYRLEVERRRPISQPARSHNHP